MEDEHPLKSDIYLKSETFPSRINQGEILSNVVQFKLDWASRLAGNPKGLEVPYKYAVVVSQDCDLLQDYNARGNQEPKKRELITSVLLCQVEPAESLIIDATLSRKEIKDYVVKGKNSRFQFFEAVNDTLDLQGFGIPESIVDFKMFFTVPTEELYERIKIGECLKRCMLGDLYREHLLQRFTNYLGRIGLPRGHFSEK